jgi:hypothetical protein
LPSDGTAPTKIRSQLQMPLSKSETAYYGSIWSCANFLLSSVCVVISGSIITLHMRASTGADVLSDATFCLCEVAVDKTFYSRQNYQVETV